MNEASLRQYAAVHETVGWRDLSGRGKVRITGPDRVTFLHAMISNEVEGLMEGEGRYGTLLTATGKILADFYYYRLADFLLIDIAPELLCGFLENLRKYIIMDDVELEDISEQLGHFAIEGPKSTELMQKILGEDAPPDPDRFLSVDWEGEALWWIRKDELVEPGFEIVLPSRTQSRFVETVAAAGSTFGFVKVEAEAFEVLRLERGIPVNGIDFSDRNNPVEVRLSDAYSLTKGCYTGQEVVSKATRVGSVPKALSRLILEGQDVPERGASVTDQEGREIGRITSAVFSPILGCPIALAYLKKGFWVPGAVHRVGRLKAEVTDSFQ